MTSTLGGGPRSDVPPLPGTDRLDPRAPLVAPAPRAPGVPPTPASPSSGTPGPRTRDGSRSRGVVDSARATGTGGPGGSGLSAWSGPGSVRWAGVRLGDVTLMQLLMVGLLGLAVVGDLVTGSGSAAGTLPVGADGALLLTLTLAAAVGGRVPHRAVAVLPVADLVVAALVTSGTGATPGSGPGLLAGLAIAAPSLWLGLRLGRTGVAVAAGTALLAQAAAVLLSPSGGAGSWRAWVLVVLVAGGAGAVAASAAFTRRGLDRARAGVEDLERRTQTIIDSVDVGLLELDPEGAYRSVNRQHEHFMALASPDGHPRTVGTRGSLFCADGVTPLPDDQVPTTRAMRGEQLADDLCWVGPDPATRRGLAISSTQRRAPDGRLLGVVLVFKDVTELIRALRVKDEFVASVSHELRTPLTSIIGYVDLVLEDTDDVPDEVRHHLEAVRRNARRLRRLVDDLLTTAGTGARSSATDLRPTPVRVNDLVATCLREARGPAEERGLALELTPTDGPEDPAGPGALVVHGDEERLAQVLDNLVGNAVKYTPRGGRVTAGVTAEGDQVVVRVSDTGRGIAPEDLGEIFDSFYRTDDVQGDAIPGVGLGLAITKRLVEAHHGEISATSRLGEGTTVEVRLPRMTGPQASLPTNGVE
ncbi:hypothetical protein GCM10027596_13440 [Nocardioides korecus]